MKIAIMYGMTCGHFTEREEIVFLVNDINGIHPKLDLALLEHKYCERCNDFLPIKRINVFVIERDIPEIT